MKLVQGSDGTLFSVDLEKNTCSCHQAGCDHLAWAIDIYQNHGKRNRFSIMSACHKTARTSSIEWAWPWVEAFSSIADMTRVAKYFSKCTFEETRNIRLWAQVRNNELTPEEQVRGLILSRKKWESLPGFTEHMTWWINAHVTYRHNRDSWSEAKLRQQIRSYQTPEEGYEAWFFAKEKKQFRPALWEELTLRAERENNDRLKWYLRHQPSSGYEIMVGLELGINAFDDSANEFHQDKPNPENHVPLFREEYEDVHSYSGRRKFLHWFPELLRGFLPEQSKLRLQLSGQIWGCAFRFAAFNQKAGMLSDLNCIWPWQNVRLEQEPSAIAWLDSIFYRTSYASLEKKGIWISPSTASNTTTSRVHKIKINASNKPATNPKDSS